MKALRTLGNSNAQITPIGLGCWQFSQRKNMAGKFWPSLPQEEIDEIVRHSIEGGINWFDTAEAYGDGASERALSSALHKLAKTDEEVFVATKWWPILRTASSIKNTIDDRIKALDGYSIDLYQIHNPMSFSSIQKQMENMVYLVRENKIKHIGVSNFSAKSTRLAHEYLQRNGLSLASNQVKYSMLDRHIESNGVLETAKKLGITIIAYSPLEQGLLTGKFHDDPSIVKKRAGFRKFQPKYKSSGLKKSQPVIDELKKIAEKYQATPAQVALNWLIHFHGETVVAIPGATKLKHVEDNCKAMNFQLTEEEMKRLDELSSIFK
jgi:aryl-alcohol dehydrogenase-like predicted oxidoreductase